jgi:hypothetical protein
MFDVYYLSHIYSITNQYYSRSTSPIYPELSTFPAKDDSIVFPHNETGSTSPRIFRAGGAVVVDELEVLEEEDELLVEVLVLVDEDEVLLVVDEVLEVEVDVELDVVLLLVNV